MFHTTFNLGQCRCTGFLLKTAIVQTIIIHTDTSFNHSVMHTVSLPLFLSDEPKKKSIIYAQLNQSSKKNSFMITNDMKGNKTVYFNKKKETKLSYYLLRYPYHFQLYFLLEKMAHTQRPTKKYITSKNLGEALLLKFI